MSESWVNDLAEMHDHFGHRKVVAKFTDEQLRDLFKFRKLMMKEELAELDEAENGKDAADAIIDLCVFAIGTLDLFGVDSTAAWNRVHEANMKKQSGVKPNRPNPLGLPDLMKPEGWQPPDWSAVYLGKLDRVFE